MPLVELGHEPSAITMYAEAWAAAAALAPALCRATGNPAGGDTVAERLAPQLDKAAESPRAPLMLGMGDE